MYCGPLFSQTLYIINTQYPPPQISSLFESQFTVTNYIAVRTRGGIIGSGTMQQARRSRIRLQTNSSDFSIYLLLPAALSPLDRLSL
jgi:hypothetical protein